MEHIKERIKMSNTLTKQCPIYQKRKRDVFDA